MGARSESAPDETVPGTPARAGRHRGRRPGLEAGAALGLSAFARRPRRWAFGAYFTDVDGITARGEMHIRGDGYIGVAPLPDGAANVCVVREVAPGSGTRRFDQSRVIGDALAADPALCERFASARSIAPVSDARTARRRIARPGIPGLLLAGDAAGFVDPMTGDGLRFALRGGDLAANAALSELDSGRAAFARSRRRAHARVRGQMADQPGNPPARRVAPCARDCRPRHRAVGRACAVPDWRRRRRPRRLSQGGARSAQAPTRQSGERILIRVGPVRIRRQH